MIGTMPGAFVMASKWTIPIRPIPTTPTLTVFAPAFVSTFIVREEEEEDDALDRCNLLTVGVNENASFLGTQSDRIVATATAEITFIISVRFYSIFNSRIHKQDKRIESVFLVN